MSSIETVDTISIADSSRTAGTYTVSSFTTDGSGTGAVFAVTVDGGGAASISVSTKGSNYASNDTITIPDSQLGNGGGASLTFDVNEVS